MPVYTNDNAIYSLLESYVDVRMVRSDDFKDIKDITIFDSMLITAYNAEEYAISVTALGLQRKEWEAKLIPHLVYMLTEIELSHLDCYLFNGLFWYTVIFHEDTQQFIFQCVKPKPKVLREGDVLFTTQEMTYHMDDRTVCLTKTPQNGQDIEQDVKRGCGYALDLKQPLDYGTLERNLTDSIHSK